MTAMNVVRTKVKPGREKDYLDYHRNLETEFEGAQAFKLVKTGDREYILVGEWDDMDALVAARPKMISTLDGIRDMLEDLGGGLGVTDPRSGEVVVDRDG